MQKDVCLQVLGGREVILTPPPFFFQVGGTLPPSGLHGGITPHDLKGPDSIISQLYAWDFRESKVILAPAEYV